MTDPALILEHIAIICDRWDSLWSRRIEHVGDRLATITARAQQTREMLVVPPPASPEIVLGELSEDTAGQGVSITEPARYLTDLVLNNADGSVGGVNVTPEQQAQQPVSTVQNVSSVFAQVSGDGKCPVCGEHGPVCGELNDIAYLDSPCGKADRDAIRGLIGGAYDYLSGDKPMAEAVRSIGASFFGE